MNERSIPSNERRSAWLPILAALLVGLALGVATMWMTRGRATPAQSADPPAAHEESLPAGTVELEPTALRNAGLEAKTVTKGVMPSMLEVTGVVTPDGARVTQVHPLARGVVTNVAVRVGDRVKAGQVLLTYDNVALGEQTGEFLSERAALQQAQTDLEVKRRALERGEALYKTEAIALQTLELRRAEYKNAEAAVASQRARVLKIEEQLHRYGLSDADLERMTGSDAQGSSHRTASRAVLRAPFAGIVTEYQAAVGEAVDTDRAVFSIANLSTVWVQADVYEKDLGRVRGGATVPVRVDAYPDHVFQGRLTYVSDVIDPKTRTAKVRCVVPNLDERLKLEMFARVQIPTTERREAVVVPSGAVQYIDNQPVVFIQQSPKTFMRRDVRVGTTSGDQVEILSGLEPGDSVVTAGSFYLKTALLRERIGEGD